MEHGLLVTRRLYNIYTIQQTGIYNTTTIKFHIMAVKSSTMQQKCYNTTIIQLQTEKKRTSLGSHMHLLTIPSCHADLGNARVWTLDSTET
jgi:hypothetical protein